MGIKNCDDLVGFCDKWHFTVFEITSKNGKFIRWGGLWFSWKVANFVTGEYHYTMGIALNLKTWKIYENTIKITTT